MSSLAYPREAASRRLRGRGRGRTLTRRLQSEEHGVVLVIVALLMTVFIASAALAIDLGSLDGAQRQAQAAADAGALAGAAALSTSTTAASATATTFAKSNYPTATPTVTATATRVTVTVAANPPNFFGKAYPVSASAVAGTTATVANCTTPGASCDAIFAMDSSCTSATISLGGGTNVRGGIVANGSVQAGNGGSTYAGPAIYGNASGCYWHQGGGDSFASGPTPQAPTTTWPINYATDFPSCIPNSTCTGACDVSTTPCPTANQTPSFCTQANTGSTWSLQSFNPVTYTSNNIYCAVGNGTTNGVAVQASDPTTWNGALTVSTSGKNYVEATVVAGTVRLGGGSRLEACGYSTSGYSASGCSSTIPAPATYNYPVIYAVQGGTALNDSGGGSHYEGDVFAPNGTILLGGGDGTTFMEGLDVSAPNGGITFTGDGAPTAAGSGSPGTVALLQ